MQTLMHHPHQSYIVLGYGIPDDILVDTNYTTYLSIVFNELYRSLVESSDKNIQLVVCGGETDMVPPYIRTEAGEMARWFRTKLETPGLEVLRERVSVVEENNSYSTLENLLLAKPLVPLDHAVHIYCEYTRTHRIETLSDVVFGAQLGRIHPVDFETSSQRYIDPELIQKKEKMALTHDLWALKHAENAKKHHDLYKEKITVFREHADDPNIIQKWWQERLNKEWKHLESG